MGSDDTEHTVMLCQAMLTSGGDSGKFTKCFAAEIRWWLLGLPVGVGLATARAILRLWVGFDPERSGFFSAGNGPCMRTAIIGACFPNVGSKRRELTRAHTRITHSDPKALIAAQAVTEIAALLSIVDVAPELDDLLGCMTSERSDPEWDRILEALRRCWSEDTGLSEFLSAIGGDPKKGIGGYAYHTVPAVVFLGARHGWDFEKTVSAVLDAGGDADTSGAIAGALCGAIGGTSSIPSAWLDGVGDWPVTASKIKVLAVALAQGQATRIRRHWSPALLARNLFFLVIVLAHGFARLGYFLLPSRNR